MINKKLQKSLAGSQFFVYGENYQKTTYEFDDYVEFFKVQKTFAELVKFFDITTTDTTLCVKFQNIDNVFEFVKEREHYIVTDFNKLFDDFNVSGVTDFQKFCYIFSEFSINVNVDNDLQTLLSSVTVDFQTIPQIPKKLKHIVQNEYCAKLFVYLYEKKFKND